MINPNDLIKALTVEALAETADGYFRRIEDPTFWLAKPFGSLAEAPTILQNVGMLIEGLQLCKTMTVLEFGAGTCWLSRFLHQAQLQTISCDVSQAALAIGQKLFAEFPIAGTPIAAPQFLVFDGHRINLPSGSVDRIICNDAFHHVPNQGEVLAEMARVLKPGGIAGFAEPGRFHSQSPTSQFEMRTGNVLENDIDVVEIFRIAQSVGFTDIRLKLLCDAEISLGHYQALTEAPQTTQAASRASTYLEAVRIVETNMRDVMRDRTLFFLCKGKPARDSRGAKGLCHEITSPEATYTVAAGSTLSLPLTIKNTGSASWLTQNIMGIGVVNIGTHLYDAAGAELAFDHTRHAMPIALAPNEFLQISPLFSFPVPGRFRLCIDLVAEQVAWFEPQGAVPLYVNILVS